MEQQWRHIQLLYTFEILSWRNINLQASALLQKGPPFVDLRPHRDPNEHLGPYFFQVPIFSISCHRTIWSLFHSNWVLILTYLGPHPSQEQWLQELLALMGRGAQEGDKALLRLSFDCRLTLTSPQSLGLPPTFVDQNNRLFVEVFFISIAKRCSYNRPTQRSHPYPTHPSTYSSEAFMPDIL